jgi:hypothetical protein
MVRAALSASVGAAAAPRSWASSSIFAWIPSGAVESSSTPGNAARARASAIGMSFLA